MAKWMMSFDESGTFEEDKQYFIIAGIIYEYDDFDCVRDYFVPLINRMCEIIEEDELHSKEMGATKKKFCKNVLFSHIGYFDKVKPVVYIIDKRHAKIIHWY